MANVEVGKRVKPNWKVYPVKLLFTILKLSEFKLPFAMPRTINHVKLNCYKLNSKIITPNSNKLVAFHILHSNTVFCIYVPLTKVSAYFTWNIC